MLSVIMHSVVMLNVANKPFMLNAIILTVIMLSVVMLNVVAPYKCYKSFFIRLSHFTQKGWGGSPCRGVRYLMVDNLKVDWDRFSNLRFLNFLTC
jgi:hypothetical protein